MELLAVGLETIQAWISAGGYVVLFGLLFACGLGLPMPEDIPLIVGGALIAKGKLLWPIAGACAWCGIVGGDLMLYFMSRRYGMAITKAPLLGKHVTPERIHRIERLFARYGVAVVGICRLFAGVRAAMVIAAGTIRFSFIKFIIVDGIAAAVSGGLFMFFGWWVGQKLTAEVVHEFKEFFLGGALLLAAALLMLIVWRRRHPNVHPISEAEKKVVESLARPDDAHPPTPNSHPLESGR